MLLRVTLLADGSLFADNQPVNFEQLDRHFSSFKRVREGTVLYYRESAGGVPHPHATRVIELLIKHRLAISIALASDFSDCLGADGKPRERWAPPAPKRVNLRSRMAPVRR